MFWILLGLILMVGGIAVVGPIAYEHGYKDGIIEGRHQALDRLDDQDCGEGGQP